MHTSLVFCNFFSDFHDARSDPDIDIRSDADLILTEACSASHGFRIFRFLEPFYLYVSAYFLAMSAWLVIILPSILEDKIPRTKLADAQFPSTKKQYLVQKAYEDRSAGGG